MAEIKSEKLREEIKELVLEIRQYLCNTEFAAAPFTEPYDPDVLLKKFPKQFLQACQDMDMAFMDVDEKTKKIMLKAGWIKEIKP